MLMRISAALLLTALGAVPAGAAATTIGVGAFGGVSVPIVQDDTGVGSVFGARVPVSLPAVVTVEPYIAFSSLGNGEFVTSSGTFTREGFDVTAFGLNAMLGRLGAIAPFRIFPYVGIGSHKLTRSATEDITEVGYNFGLGLGSSPVATMPLNIDVRSEFNMVVTGDTSRKFANVTLGVSYNVYSTP